MATYNEITYMCLDLLKTISDDSYFEEEHIWFLMDKYRALLLKQRYATPKKQMPESNEQTINLDLMEVPAIAGEVCEGGSYLRSTLKIPDLIHISVPKIYPSGLTFDAEVAYISKNRMKYVGYNRYLQNVIYATLGPDKYLYFKSSNPQYLYLESATMTAIFDNTKEAFALTEDAVNGTDIQSTPFPMEDAYIPDLIKLIVNELLAPTYRPQDKENNATDDLSGLTVKE